MVLTIALGIVLAFLIIIIGPWVIGAVALMVGILIMYIHDSFIMIKRKILRR